MFNTRLILCILGLVTALLVTSGQAKVGSLTGKYFEEYQTDECRLCLGNAEAIRKNVNPSIKQFLMEQGSLECFKIPYHEYHDSGCWSNFDLKMQFIEAVLENGNENACIRFGGCKLSMIN